MRHLTRAEKDLLIGGLLLAYREEVEAAPTLARDKKGSGWVALKARLTKIIRLRQRFM